MRNAIVSHHTKTANFGSSGKVGNKAKNTMLYFLATIFTENVGLGRFYIRKQLIFDYAEGMALPKSNLRKMHLRKACVDLASAELLVADNVEITQTSSRNPA